MDIEPLKLSVCFCVFNEENNVAACIRDAQENLPAIVGNDRYEIIVIDNSSTDRTPHIVENIAKTDPSVRLIRHPENRFYSGSHVTALSCTAGQYIAIIDGDNQHTTRDLKKALPLLENGSCDVVFGWKQFRKDAWVRKVFSACLRFVSQFLLGHSLHDINCGYRVLTLNAARQICIKEKINSAGPEIYCECKRLGLKVDEIVVEHFPRTQGKGMHESLFPLVKNSVLFVLYLFRLRKRYTFLLFRGNKKIL
jgi:glycosyltransferase involved in cell wall biosynthesis